MIVRTYACDCGHRMKVTLDSSQWDCEPPACPACESQTKQEFTPLNIGGSKLARAAALAETIAREDYGVANMHTDNREGGVPKVRYKDDNRGNRPSAWGRANPEALEMAAALGKQTRIQHGNPLDVISTMPDLIANSKKLSSKIW